MERLTNRGTNGEIWITDNDATRLKGRKECAYEKLAHYEKLAEQGRLVELPCKIGDTIYKIPSAVNYKLNVLNGHTENNRVYEQVVCSIKICPSGYLIETCDGQDSVIEQYLNESWFLTKSEAEQALAERKKNENIKNT